MLLSTELFKSLNRDQFTSPQRRAPLTVPHTHTQAHTCDFWRFGYYLSRGQLTTSPLSSHLQAEFALLALATSVHSDSQYFLPINCDDIRHCHLSRGTHHTPGCLLWHKHWWWGVDGELMFWLTSRLKQWIFFSLLNWFSSNRWFRGGLMGLKTSTGHGATIKLDLAMRLVNIGSVSLCLHLQRLSLTWWQVRSRLDW